MADKLKRDGEEAAVGLDQAFAANRVAHERFLSAAHDYVSGEWNTASPAPGDEASGAEAARVLVVEDEALVARALVRFFRSVYGVAVTAVETAAEGRALFETLSFDLIVVDMNLVDEPGWRVVERIRRASLRPLAPVIVISGSVIEDLPRVALKCGANAALEKPLDMQGLEREVTRLLGEGWGGKSGREGA